MSNPCEILREPVSGEEDFKTSQYACVRCHRKFKSFAGLKYHLKSVDCLSSPYAGSTISPEDGLLQSEEEIKEGCVMEAITAYVARQPQEHTENLKRKMREEKCNSFTSTTHAIPKRKPHKRLKSSPPIEPKPVSSSVTAFPVDCDNERMTKASTSPGSLTDTVPTTSLGSFVDTVPSTLQGCFMDTVPSTLQGCFMDTVPSTLQGSFMDTVPSTLQGSLKDTVPSTLLGSFVDTVPSTLQGSFMDTVPSTLLGSVQENVLVSRSCIDNVGDHKSSEGTEETLHAAGGIVPSNNCKNNCGSQSEVAKLLQTATTHLNNVQVPFSSFNLSISNLPQVVQSHPRRSSFNANELMTVGVVASNAVQTATSHLNNVQLPFSSFNVNMPQVFQSLSRSSSSYANELMTVGVVASNAVPLLLNTSVSGQSSGIGGLYVTGRQSDSYRVDGLSSFIV